MNDVIDGGDPDVRYTNSMVRSQNDVYMVVNNYGAEDNAADDNTIKSLEDGSLTRGELQRSAMNICKVLMESPVFFRKQGMNDLVKSFEAKGDLNPEKSYNLTEDPIVYPLRDKPIYIKSEKEKVYTIHVRIRSSETNLSQTTCNVKLNGQLMMTIQTTGTDGKWVTQKIAKVHLQEGIHELKLDFVKSGIDIDWIKFL